MKSILLAGAALAAAAPACAQEIKPLAEVRARHEHVEQDGLAQDSDAVTVRVRAGVQVSKGGWSALAEAQGNMAVGDAYYDGLHGAATRPLVADPENVALYRAQIQYRSGPLTFTAGRQRIMLDDERFVGNAGIRQSAQTFDAVRAEITPLKGLKLDLSYVWDVRTIWGVEGNGARQQGVGGDNILANLSYATPVGTLTGFAYLVDQDEAAVQGYRLSSQSYGVRLAGARPLGGGVKAAWQLSHARQTDYHRNPNDYAARYWLADGSLELRGWKLGAGYEVLGADKGVALTSFQTPLGSVFKFQGWADKFTVTPPDGIRDLYANIGYGWKALGPFTGVTLQAAYHRFDSDRLVRRYGDEIDMLVSGKLGKTILSVRYADYAADRLLTDTRKLWLQLDWVL
ncbi:alginate export family protein [Sphingomonas sp. DG1-23]|uniref:alginate export family protein n=1 Tax=Sphingomonas sp. DG1-23 TaxID=3068316 RepID=UPI00273E1D18|nr:alginate export family protein [Sphingomonas sp. DG1-23]MDP5278134.1 alginate export family protein [Sphingomonas sp. DG1-23]